MMHLPDIQPKANPRRTCCKNMAMIAPGEIAVSNIRRITHMVRRTAIGSLLPDSNSSNGLNCPFKLTRRERRIEKTAAASVEDITEPSSRPSSNENFNTSTAKTPTNRAVKKTPMVARATPCQTTGRTARQSVSRPPEKMIRANAIVPSNLVT